MDLLCASPGDVEGGADIPLQNDVDPQLAGLGLSGSWPAGRRGRLWKSRGWGWTWQQMLLEQGSGGG